VFFLSGSSALVYQVLWLRLLSLTFGVTVYAASTVLAAFMGGLAAGSLVAGRIADRARNPLVLFGATELLIAGCGLASPFVLNGVQRLYVASSAALPDSLILLTLLRFLFSFGVLLVPTAAMGATLPLIIRSSLGRGALIGERVALLYGINTAGAILGTMAAGFYLISNVGLMRSFLLAAMINVTAGAIALLASRRPGVVRVPDTSGPVPDAVPASRVSWVRRLVLAVFAVSGFASLALEVIWFRVLVIFLGPTAYAFTLMLASVLAGIALGSWIVTPLMKGARASKARDWLAILAVAELAIGFASVLSFTTLGDRWTLPGWLQPMLARPWMDYLVPVMLSSLATILPTAVLLGLAFPIGLHIWTGAGNPGIAKRIGVFYSVNVCGAIAGSIVAGFLLLPLLGSRPSLIVISSLSLASGLVLLATAWPRRRAVTAALLVLPLFVAASRSVPDLFDRALRDQYRGQHLYWREEGVQTTVSVLVRPPSNLILYLDGRHQASDIGGSMVHRRIGLLAAALHPSPRRGLVVGLGGGVTAGGLSQYPGLQLDVVELSRGVARGAAFFTHVNFDVLRAPNVRLRIDDGRNYLLLQPPASYDLVTADTILPRHAGANNLSSIEYFELARRALAEDGLMLQWNGGETEVEYKLILRTFLKVFPHTTLWEPSLMVGAKRPFTLSRARLEEKLRDPQTAAALKLIGVDSVDQLLSLYVAGPEALRRHVGDGPVLSDDRPLIEYFVSLPTGGGLPGADLVSGGASELLRP
jgi:spermidine synthase